MPEQTKESIENKSDNLQSLIEKNIKWSQANYELSKKINHKLMWLLISGYLKWALILIPLILGLIYLPPLLKDLFSQYQGLLDSTGTMKAGLGDVSSLNSDQLQNLLKAIVK